MSDIKVEPESEDRVNVERTAEEPTTREITQTDHINKQLLSSFLQRLNQINPQGIGQQQDNDEDNSTFAEDNHH